MPKWSEAFRKSIADLTGQEIFKYNIAVTRLVGEGDPLEWTTDPTIKSNLPGCPVGFLVLEDMWKKMLEELTKTPASMNQLPRDMREALAANARTKVVFACSPEDAAHLERHFEPLLMAHDLHNLGSFQAACRPCVDAGHGTPFTFTTEPLASPIEERAARARKLSGERFGTPRADVEAEIGRRHSNPHRRLLPDKGIRSEQAGVSQGVPGAVSRGVAEGVTS